MGSSWRGSKLAACTCPCPYVSPTGHEKGEGARLRLSHLPATCSTPPCMHSTARCAATTPGSTPARCMMCAPRMPVTGGGSGCRTLTKTSSHSPYSGSAICKVVKLRLRLVPTCKHRGHPAACPAARFCRRCSHHHPSPASPGRPTWAGLVGLRCLASTRSVGAVMVTMGRPLSRNLGAVCSGAGQGVSIGHVRHSLLLVVQGAAGHRCRAAS